MAELGFDFNASEHKPLESYDPIPAGDYEAVIVESERVATSRGDGELLKLVWLIVSGEYEGRKVFDRVNLANPNQQAVEIGRRQLTSICNAVGKRNISDSSELHEIPCIIKVKVKPAGPDKNGVHREAGNDVKGYEPAGQQPVGAGASRAPVRQAPAPTRAPAAPAAPARKPWERNK